MIYFAHHTVQHSIESNSVYYLAALLLLAVVALLVIGREK
jgi:hypothetical protein